MAETMALKSYLGEILQPIRRISDLLGVDPLDSFKTFQFWWKVPRLDYDNHDGLRIICAALQEGEVVKDDRFILPWVCGVHLDPDDPHVAIEFDPYVKDNLG